MAAPLQMQSGQLLQLVAMSQNLAKLLRAGVLEVGIFLSLQPRPH